MFWIIVVIVQYFASALKSLIDFWIHPLLFFNQLIAQVFNIFLQYVPIKMFEAGSMTRHEFLTKSVFIGNFVE